MEENSLPPRSEEDNPLLTDRTSIETDWKCGMALWWYKFAEGHGIVPAIEPDYFSVGKDVHDGFAELTLGKPLASVLASFPPPPKGSELAKFEQWSRLIGWLTAFHEYRLPQIMEKYDIVAVEKEIVYDQQPPLWVAVTPDLILLDKADGKRVYREYKSAFQLGPGWASHWRYAVQVHLGIEAAAKEYGPMKWGQIMGMWKGRPYKGKLFHPYVWVYGGPEGKLSLTSKSGYEPIAFFDILDVNKGDIERASIEWVRKLGEDAANEVFGFSEPIYLDPRMIEGLGVRQNLRQEEIKQYANPARTDRIIRLQHFEQRFTECKPVVGQPCPYLSACFNKTVGEDPIGSGLYVARTPHHELEVLGWEGEGE